MSFTYDLTTIVGKIRLLIGDINATNPAFTDEELSAFYALVGNSLYLACAQALEQLAATAASSSTSFTLGDYSVSGGTNKFASFTAQAKRFRDLEENTPAFGIADVNLSDFNALQMIANQIQRTGE